MTHDTGKQLRSLYQAQGGVGEIFGAKVADYDASRPGYPAQLFETLRAHGHLTPTARVVDLGAGTGLLTRGLLQSGATVVAVEPNAPMRRACDHLLQGEQNYRSVDGTAEAIPLESASVDLITAAQAFHWFEIERARAECLRVLRPDGQVALIWNDRVLSDPLHVALDDVFAVYGGAKRAALLAHEDRSQVAQFFGEGAPAEFYWPHAHGLSEGGLLSLVFSRSYMPERGTQPGQQVAGRVREIFRAMAVDGEITVRYTTVLTLGRLQACKG